MVTGWGTLSFGRQCKYTPPAVGDPAWFSVATLAPVAPPWCGFLQLKCGFNSHFLDEHGAGHLFTGV